MYWSKMKQNRSAFIKFLQLILFARRSAIHKANMKKKIKIDQFRAKNVSL